MTKIKCRNKIKEYMDNLKSNTFFGRGINEYEEYTFEQLYTLQEAREAVFDLRVHFIPMGIVIEDGLFGEKLCFFYCCICCMGYTRKY
jgi:hypothetical protein